MTDEDTICAILMVVIGLTAFAFRVLTGQSRGSIRRKTQAFNSTAQPPPYVVYLNAREPVISHESIPMSFSDQPSSVPSVPSRMHLPTQVPVPAPVQVQTAGSAFSSGPHGPPPPRYSELSLSGIDAVPVEKVTEK
jgi:hypothetical protein